MAGRPGPQIAELVHRSLPLTIYDVKWVPGTAKFVVLGCRPSGSGVLQAYELEGPQLVEVAKWEQPASLKCGSFGAGMGSAAVAAGQHLVLGDQDGQLQLLDVERLDAGPLFRSQAHSGVVHSLDAFHGQGAPEVVTCGNSYSAQERCVLAGYANGDIKMFDLRAGTVRWETNVGKGVCGLQFDRRDIPMNKFVAACLESRLCLFDARTEHPTAGFAGRVEAAPSDATLWGVQHLPQNRDVFMVRGGDGSLALHKYQYPDQRAVTDARTGELMGVAGSTQQVCSRDISCQPVSGFDWSPNKAGVFVAAAFDQTVRVGMVTQLSSL